MAGYALDLLARNQEERALIVWAANQQWRNALVRRAHAAGVTKYRIHVLTGISRTTIDRILTE